MSGGRINSHASHPTLGISGNIRKDILRPSSQNDLLGDIRLPTGYGFKQTIHALLDGVDLGAFYLNRAIAVEVGFGLGPEFGRIAMVLRRDGVHVFAICVSVLARVEENRLVVLADD